MSKVTNIFLDLRCMKRLRTQRISSDIQSIEAVSEETVGQHSHNDSCYHLAHEDHSKFEKLKSYIDEERPILVLECRCVTYE